MNAREPLPDQHESRAAVALTVAWMLACTSTAVAMLVVLALRLLMIAFPVAAGGVHPVAHIAGVLLFVAMMTGALCLGFTPLTYRIRHAPPPRAITIAAILIGLSPIVMLIVLAVAAGQR
jgi:hypothetical protein